MLVQRTIVSTYRKVKLVAQESDFKYRQAQPVEKRLETLEQLRNEYYSWKYDTQPGFQRVLSIAKRK
jgi:hypothetical protein